MKISAVWEIVGPGLEELCRRQFVHWFEPMDHSFWNATAKDWHPGNYGMTAQHPGRESMNFWWNGAEGATYAEAKVEPMAAIDLLKASGLWNEPVTPENLAAVRAFVQRPWEGHCTIDDICMQSAKHDIDPELLIRLAEAAGELDTKTWF